MALQLSPEDYMDDDDVSYFLSQLSPNKTSISYFSSRSTPEPSQPRRTPPRSHRVTIRSYSYHNINIRAGANVELDDGIHFMRVVEVIQDTDNGEVSIRGWLFKRAAFMDGLVERKLNEVCWILDVEENDPRDPKEQGIREIPVARVIRRRTMELTNLPFPDLSFRDKPSGDSMDVIKRRGVLVCRWKYITSYPTADAKMRESYSEKALFRLNEEESDKPNMGDDTIRRMWRGPTIKGGTSFGVKPEESAHLKHEHFEEKRAQLLIQQSSRKRSTSPSEESQVSYYIDISTDDDDEIQELRYLPTARVTDLQWIERRCSQGSPRKRRFRSLEPPERQIRSSISSDRDFDNRRPSLAPLAQSPHFVDLSLEDEIKGTRSNGISGSPPKKLCTSAYKEDVPLRRPLPLEIQPISPEDSDTQPGRRISFVSLDLDDDKPLIGTRRCSIVSINDDSDATSRRKHSIISINDNEPTSCMATPKTTPFGNTVNETPLEVDNLEATTGVSGGTQRYTFADAFCGAGGTSRGASMAGLRVQWGSDHNEHACLSWSQNFPFANILQRDIFEVITRQSGLSRVDILHLSPPCQFFSPAHTTAGQNDEANTAASFAIAGMLQCAKPRIVTLENTSGLLRQHEVWLHAVINQFTSLGFSIRWKLLCFQDYGLGQRRERLIIIASW